MPHRLRRLACALALALAAPAQAGWSDTLAETLFEAQSSLADLLRFLEPRADETLTPSPPQAPDFPPEIEGVPASEQSVVDQLAAGANAGVLRPPLGLRECTQGLPDDALDLALVASQALCNHPKTRATWSQARAEAARVEVARAAWQPTVQAGAAFTAARYAYPEPTGSLSANTLNLELRLSLVLYDAGRREARFDSAVAVLDAANSTQDATVQQVLLEATQAYFAMRAAQAQLTAARGAEDVARETLETAEARFQAGVAARIEALQAASALAQASLERAQAEAVQKNALGGLAVKIGLSAESPLRLVPPGPPPAQWEPPGSASSLIAEARQFHPALRAARKQLVAAAAQIDLARAEGLPSLTGNLRHQRNEELQSTPLAGFDTNNSLGLQLSIPLYEGQARQAQIRAAEAEYDTRQFETDSIEQEVSLEVWSAYNDLGSERERLATGEKLVVNARLALDITQGRYKAGVGDILEVLNAQKTLAQAERQRIESQGAWQSARLRLAAAVGRIGVWAVD